MRFDVFPPYLLFFYSILFLSFPLLAGGKNIPVVLYVTRIAREWALFLLLIFFIAFRGFLIADWPSYYTFYNRIPTLHDGIGVVKEFITMVGWESGFVFYAILCKTINTNYFFFTVISSIIDIIILYFFLKTYVQKNIVLGFAFFFLFGCDQMEFAQLRNVKAIMLFLISINYIERKKILSYLSINALGIMFHTSAIFYLPVYFILNKRYPQKIILFLFFIGNIIFLSGLSWVKKMIVFLGKFIGTRLADMIAFYVLDEKYGNPFGISIGYLERQLTFLLFFFFYTKLIKKKDENMIFINMMYLYLFLFLYFSEMRILVNRLPLLFICSYWVLYPQIYTMLSKKNKILFLLLLMGYGSIKIINMYSYSNAIYDNILLGSMSYYERLILSSKALAEQNP